MRISAGKYKGRLLKSPSGLGKKIRPSSARVKEAFFNIIGAHVRNAYFLDIFSGTGSIGLEALSRGAERVFFVENNRLSLGILRRNIKLTGVQAQVKILPLEVKRALYLLGKVKESFEVIYIDPPYSYPGREIVKILNYIRQKDLVKPEGIVAVERGGARSSELLDSHGSENELKRVPFSFWKKKIYGNTILFFYREIKY